MRERLGRMLVAVVVAAMPTVLLASRAPVAFPWLSCERCDEMFWHWWCWLNGYCPW